MGEDNALKGKRILFLSASLFGYQYEIRAAMERMGATVDYFDERPANTFLVKAMIRINRNFIAGYIDRYHNRIVEQTRVHRYDAIFITKGESISPSTLEKLRAAHPEAKLIIYHWDSIANNKNALSTLPLFDKVFSFDKPDCQALGLHFLPLFYLPEYQQVGPYDGTQDIDILFVGTAHSDRYKLIKQLTQGLKSYLYIYFPSPLLYYKMRLSDPAFKGTKKSDFRFTSLSKGQVLELYEHSKAIIDIQHPRQTGLTMRSIEVLGAERKFITTNSHIKEYDFYHPNNILVIDRHNPTIDHDFIDLPYHKIDEQVYEKYKLENWIKTIIL